MMCVYKRSCHVYMELVCFWECFLCMQFFYNKININSIHVYCLLKFSDILSF